MDSPSALSPPKPSRLSSAALWLAVAIVYGAALGLATLIGLKIGERGVDTRSIAYLVTTGAGGALGLLALAPVYDWLVPRPVWARYGMALLCVAGATAAAIALLAFLQTESLSNALGPNIPLKIRFFMIVEPYAANVFLFLTIGMQPLLPQGLVPVILAGVWLARRRIARH